MSIDISLKTMKVIYFNKECEYGVDCYRKNPQHKKDFKHTRLPQPKRQVRVFNPRPGSTRSTPARGRGVDRFDSKTPRHNYYVRCG